MKKDKKIAQNVKKMTENEKLDLFKVEELEDRLEMAALAAKGGSDDGICWVSA